MDIKSECLLDLRKNALVSKQTHWEYYDWREQGENV